MFRRHIPDCVQTCTDAGMKEAAVAAISRGDEAEVRRCVLACIQFNKGETSKLARATNREVFERWMKYLEE